MNIFPAIDLIDDPQIIIRAKAEKDRRTGNEPYICPIPKDVRPPFPAV